MNKKILLSSLVAAGVLIPTMLTTNVNAAKIDGKSLTSSISKNNNDEYILSVLLPVKNKGDYTGETLNKSKVTEIVNAKYGTYDSVKEIKNNRSDDAVGTGSIVELNSNKTLKVVLYGDINGDGKVGTGDSISLSKHNTSKSVITDSLKLKAAKLTKVNEYISTSDSVRLSKYNTNKLGSNLLIDEELFPEDTVINSDSVLQGAVDEINAEKERDFTITLDSDNNKGKFVFSNEKKDTDLIKDLKYQELVSALLNKLNEYKNTIKEIDLTFNGNENPVKLTSDMQTIEAIKTVAKELIGAEDPSTANLGLLNGKELEAKFILNNNAEFVETGVSTEIKYTLKFLTLEKYTADVLADAVKEVNENNQSYSIELNSREKTGKFKFKNDSDSIATFKDLADTLADYLNDNKAMLKDIVLKLDDNQTPVTLTPGMSIDQIKKVAKDLLETAKIEKVSDLKGKNLKVTFNLNDNNQAEEYSLSFTTETE